uniref:Uncharacterized protein n=1 Tax=Candidatus Kentrum sp. FW TaxID=2126338 RepID=A0A450TW25_9GAMM|nr:MAG: hypothetical protein BECKFW1821C_GA0114237_10478 [Candidatus Kentron sp. FW]
MRWISTPESVEKNEPTVLAIVETVLAVAAYWGIAIWFDTHIHLLVSICVAPLLLLRSRESTEKGVRWFVSYFEDKTEITLHGTPARFWILLLLIVVIITTFTYGSAKILLVQKSNWTLVSSIGIGMVSWMITLTVSVAVTRKGIATREGAGMAVVGMVVGLGVGAGMLAGTEVGVVMVTAVAGLLVPIGAAIGTGTAAGIFILIVYGIPITMGMWLGSLIIRMSATLYHPLRGLLTLPENWRRFSLGIDSYHGVELMVPGVENHIEQLSLSGEVVETRSGEVYAYAGMFLVRAFWFFPGLFYRWSIKSTCWLYLPLIYLGGGLRWRPHMQEEKAWLVAGLHKSPVQSIRRWLAIGVAVSLVITTALNYPTFQAEIQGSLSDAPKSMKSFLWFLDRLEHVSLPYLWAFDFFDLASWQWLNLLGAVLTGGLWIYSDRVNRIWTRAKERDSSAVPKDVHIVWLLQMTRARNLCAILYVLLAFGYCVLALGGIDKELLTGWLAPLDFLYGPYL